VSFLAQGTLLDTVPLANGVATLTTTPSVAESEAISAAYSGDPNDLPGAASLLLPVSAPAPTVTSLVRTGVHLEPTHLVLTFSTPLNAASALNLVAYRLVLLAPGKERGTLRAIVIKLKSAVYDPVHQRVTLRPRQRLNLRRPYLLTASGTGPSAIKSAAGLALDGKGTGQPGSDYQALILGFGPLGAAPML
jgi:hypothetical protein